MYKEISETLKSLPNQAGVYQYFDKNSRLLYIGKAKNLKNRIRSYWKFRPSLHPNPTLNMRTLHMLSYATYIEYIVVESEEDALILENSLIKQLNPKYNILLRDDKSYPYIYIDENQDFPRFELTRKIIKGKKVRYYGPFPNGGKVLLDALYEIFPLVQKKSCLREGRACLFYQIGKCLAPCEYKIDRDDYLKIVEDAKDAINRRKILIDALNKRMITLATAERFEEAVKVRDNIKTIKALTIKSTLDLISKEDIDIFAITTDGTKGVIIKLFMRLGKIISSSSSIFKVSNIFDSNQLYRQVLLDFYREEIPQTTKTILVAEEFEDKQEVSKILTRRLSKKINIIHPKKGAKQKLINLALNNANEILKNNPSKEESIERRVAELFELESVPYRVESFDNSHMMGSATVGAMVVWENGEWIKKDYRRYELNAKDEYGQMKEMLTRRVKKISKNYLPDLWILDGGETLRKLAKKLLEESNIDLDVIAIAKEKIDSKANRAKGSANDIVYTSKSVFELQPTDNRLQWIQRQRDEAHRFAITYHQNKKRKEDIESSLLQKKGIGKATLKKLLNYFGTFNAIKNATFEEISVASSKKVAKILKT